MYPKHASNIKGSTDHIHIVSCMLAKVVTEQSVVSVSFTRGVKHIFCKNMCRRLPERMMASEEAGKIVL